MNRSKMSEKGQIMQISLLPLLVIVGLIIGAGYLMTKGDIKMPFGDSMIEFRRLEGFPTVLDVDKVLEGQRIVVRSQEELDELLSTTGATLGERIDFEKEILIVASTKTRDEGGYSIKIRRVYKKGSNELVASIRDKRTNEECITEQHKNIAIDIVAVSKTSKDVTFEAQKEYQDCEE